jgi:hypothetical protein
MKVKMAQQTPKTMEVMKNYLLRNLLFGEHGVKSKKPCVFQPPLPKIPDKKRQDFVMFLKPTFSRPNVMFHQNFSINQIFLAVLHSTIWIMLSWQLGPLSAKKKRIYSSIYFFNLYIH